MWRVLGALSMLAWGCGDDAATRVDAAPDASDASDVGDVDEGGDTGADGVDEVAADTVSDTDADTAAHEIVDDAKAPFQGSGVSGGEIDGAVTVFVIDALRGGGLAGATVRVTIGDEVVSAVSDADGRAHVARSGLVGPVDVEVVAGGFGFRKVLGLHAAIAVTPLWDLVDADGYAVGSYSGATDLSALPPAPENGVRAGFAYPVLRSVLGATPYALDAARAGSPWLERMTVSDATGVVFDHYTLSAYPDQSYGVAVIGGTLAGNMPGFPFTVSHVGFSLARTAVGAPQEMPLIAVDVPVSEKVTLALGAAPYPTRSVSSWMRLPGGEVVLIATAPSTNGDSFVARTVAASGPFERARRLFWIDASNNAGTRSSSVLLASDASEIAADDYLPEPNATIAGLALTTKLAPYVDVRSAAVSVDGKLIGTITFTRDPRGANYATNIVPSEIEAQFAGAARRQVAIVDFYARGLDRTDAPPGRLAELTTKTAVTVLNLP